MVQSINGTTPLEEARAALAAAYDLTYTRAVARVTQHVYDRVRHRIPEADWAKLAPLIVHINRLKREKKTSILVHVRQPSEIYFGVADRTGDNLSLLRQVSQVRQPNLLYAGVRSMAESVKLLVPNRRVLISDSRSRCSMSTTITPEDVLAIRGQYAGVPVAVHVNTSLAVKAVADLTFTAANAVAVAGALQGNRVIMLPDQFLAQHVARQTKKKIITWAGACDTHSSFTDDAVEALRRDYPDAKILAHPQTRPAVAAAADFTGSSGAVLKWLKAEQPAQAAILSDQAVVDNLAPELPGTEFVGNGGGSAPENEMRVTLENILWSLHTMTEEVTVSSDLSPPARAALQRMLELSKGVD
jgi:quinolinate synthase